MANYWLFACPDLLKQNCKAINLKLSFLLLLLSLLLCDLSNDYHILFFLGLTGKTLDGNISFFLLEVLVEYVGEQLED